MVAWKQAKIVIDAPPGYGTGLLLSTSLAIAKATTGSGDGLDAKPEN